MVVLENQVEQGSQATSDALTVRYTEQETEVEGISQRLLSAGMASRNPERQLPVPGRT